MNGPQQARIAAPRPVELTALTKPRPAGADDDRPDSAAASIGAYRLVAILGQGGMGEVFLAWDERLKRNVAIKRIRAERSRDAASRDRFRREARAVAQLNHPSIVQVFDVIEGDEEVGDAIVMEHVEGRSLMAAITAGDLDLPTIVRLACEIAAGLGEAHGKGVVHRDLKPENVLLTAGPRPRAKILDFGLARALWKDALINNPGEPLTQSGAVIGTAYAMSPEQANGRNVDHRSDLFALGSLLYQMLSGTAPFRGESVLDTLQRVHAHHPPPVCTLRRDVPPALSALTMRLLAKDPAGRPVNAHLVEEELRRIALELETAAPGTLPAALSALPTLEHAPRPEEAAPGSHFNSDSWVETVIRTLVLTDLVDSTRLVESLGDLNASEVFARHDRMARDLLARYNGLEVDKSDGFLLLFRRPFDAIGYTLAYHRALAELAAELDVALAARAAVHLGEVVLRRNRRQDVSRGAKPVEVEGLAKPTAARLMYMAGAHQTLLSRSAFDLGRRAAVDEQRWDDSLCWLAHGSYVVQGVNEPLEVFEVGLGGVAPLVAPADTEKARRVGTASDNLVLGWRPAAGQAIPRRPNWTLAERLGEGGFGEVWLARHKSGERRVFKFCFEAARLRSLKREVTLFRLLRDALGQREDIARILDWSFEEAPYFLEVEHTEGGSLSDWAERQGGLAAVSLTVRLEIAAQVAVALAAAHSVGILHKDVKPANVLVSTTAAGRIQIRLTDFGIGRLTDETRLDGRHFTIQGMTAAEETSSAQGTQIYMAPELLEGKPATVQGDIYSLGVLTYQLVVGDFRRVLAPGWRRDVEDELLASDIKLFVDGNAERRPPSALEVATRLRELEPRRARLESERREREAAEAALKALARAQRRRRLLGGIAALATVFLAVVSIFAVEAYKARLASERRRASAEELVTFMLGDLRDNLAPTNRLEVLERVGQAVEGYFSRLQDEDLTDATQAQRAELLRQIGDVRLGQGNLEGASAAFREALALAENLSARDPGNAEWRFGLGNSHYWIGVVRWRQGDLAGALQAFQKYLDNSRELVSRAPAESRWQLEVAYGHESVGTILLKLRNVDAALGHFRELHETMEALTSQDPANADWQFQLANSHLRLAMTLSTSGRLLEALEHYRADAEIIEALVERNPDHTGWRARLAASHSYLAQQMRILGAPAQAVEHVSAQLEMARRLTGLDPDNTKWHYLEAKGHLEAALVCRDQGKSDEAGKHLEASLPMLLALEKAEPANTDWQMSLATWHSRKGAWLLARSEPDAAWIEARTAHRIVKERMATAPDDPQTREELSEIEVLSGRILKAQGASEQAREAWSEALAIIEPQARGSAFWKDLDPYARALTYLGRCDEAAAVREKLGGMGYRGLEDLESCSKTESARTVP